MSVTAFQEMRRKRAGDTRSEQQKEKQAAVDKMIADQKEFFAKRAAEKAVQQSQKSPGHISPSVAESKPSTPIAKSRRKSVSG